MKAGSIIDMGEPGDYEEADLRLYLSCGIRKKPRLFLAPLNIKIYVYMNNYRHYQPVIFPSPSITSRSLLGTDVHFSLIRSWHTHPSKINSFVV